MQTRKKSKEPSEKPAPKVIYPPAEIATAIDRITSEDRDWFGAHPGLELRTRPAAQHEFWPVFDSVNVLYVIVTQVRPGYRLRFPVVRLHRPKTERVQ
jgi:hypothetical protein